MIKFKKVFEKIKNFKPMPLKTVSYMVIIETVIAALGTIINALGNYSSYQISHKLIMTGLVFNLAAIVMAILILIKVINDKRNAKGPMKTKGCNPIEYLEGRDASILLQTYFEINNLKRLYRQGWLKKGRNIPEDKCESIGDHAYAVTTYSYFIADQYYPELDLMKVISMAVVHELVEIYAGDWTPHDGISEEEKYKIEEEACKRFTDKFSNGNKYFKLWQEFEKGETPEADFVKQIDKLEAVLQAGVYQCEGYDVLESFHTWTKNNKRIKLEELTKIMDELETLKR